MALCASTESILTFVVPIDARRTMLTVNRIHLQDATEGLKQLDDESIDCVITSPPYWATRDYGIKPTRWSDGSLAVLGLEGSCEQYVDHLLEVFDLIRRVLKASGTLWVNLSDTYSGRWGNYAPEEIKVLQRSQTLAGERSHRLGYTNATPREPSPRKQSAPAKSLCGIPERFVLGMLKQGWILRNRVIWHKPNHMPSSVKDRFSSSWEYLFLFTKCKRYYFDLDAVREPHASMLKRPMLARSSKRAPARISPHIDGRRLPPNPGEAQSFNSRGKNPSDYWSIPPETRTGGAILGKNGAVKVPGGSGWTGHPSGGQARIVRERDPRWLSPGGKNPGDSWTVPAQRGFNANRVRGSAHFATFPERLCVRPILAGCPPDGLVLDPFMGSGTTAVVARRLGRRFIGFELNPQYVALAGTRLNQSKPKGGHAIERRAALDRTPAQC